MAPSALTTVWLALAAGHCAVRGALVPGAGARPAPTFNAARVRHVAPALDAGAEVPSPKLIPAAVADAAGWAQLSPHAAAAATANTELPSSLQWRLHRATWYLSDMGGESSLAIRRAAQIATQAHAGQKRKSGEDFIIHPVETACILADLKMDVHTIVAGLLHDTVEDTELSLDDVRDMFGGSVATIVQGDSKVCKLYRELDAMPAAERMLINQREMLIAMSADWRIVVVKLADRLHNMRTLQHMPRHKQVRIARETVEIFVPLARRLGIVELERELLQCCVHYLFPAELKGVFGFELLGHWLRLQFWGVLDRKLRSDEVLHEFEVDSKLLSHRDRWVQHTNYWAVAFAE